MGDKVNEKTNVNDERNNLKEVPKRIPSTFVQDSNWIKCGICEHSIFGH